MSTPPVAKKQRVMAESHDEGENMETIALKGLIDSLKDPKHPDCDYEQDQTLLKRKIRAILEMNTDI